MASRCPAHKLGSHWDFPKIELEMADTKVYARHFQTLTKIVGDADPSDQKSTAKDKLAKLSAQQFSELSTDVYDEVVRREVKDFPFLPVDVQFHPKRNQARQKLATLQLARFQELCRDVKWEIEQRFPEIGKISQGSLQNLAASAPLSNLAVKGLKGKEDSVRSNDSLNLMGSNHQLAPNVPNEIARKDGEIAKLKRELNDSRQQNLKLESALNAKSNECSELKADYDNQVSVINSQLGY